MEGLEKLKFTREHEWVRIEGDKGYVGITDFAQDELGDIVFVELPEKGAELEAGDVLATVESVKAASDIYAPISGIVLEVNDELELSPELLNEAPYEAWIAVVEMIDEMDLINLMDEMEYEEFIKEEIL